MVASHRVERSEWVFVAVFAIAILVITSLPYLYGHVACPGDGVFMGIVYGVSDTAQYFSWLRDFREGFFIDNHLTPEPNARVFMNLQWWLLAQLACLLHLTHLQVFHVFRLLAIAVFAVVMYWFVSLCFVDRSHRRTAFVMVQVGSGLGWLWVVLKYLVQSPEVAYPFDLYTIEPNSFLSQMAFPHFTMAAALIILTLGLMLKAIERRRWRYALVASGVALVLGLSHAYDLLLIYAIVGLYVLLVWLRDGFSWGTLWMTCALGMISCWPAFYSVYITSSRFPVWQAVLAQFDLAGAWTPDPFHLLFLLGLPFVVAVGGFDGLVPLQERSLPRLFVRVWFVANLFMAYFPVKFQIHYLNGWQVPIAVLATEVVYERILPSIRSWPVPRARTVVRWLSVAVILAVVPTNLYLLAWRFIDLGRHRHPYYIHRDEGAALEWLAGEVTADQVVFCARAVGQYVPSQTGARPFLGHWAMTKDLYEKQALVEVFFDVSTSHLVRRAILDDFGVDYVLWGTAERDLGLFDPSTAPYLSPCFTAPQAAVYCVRESEIGARGP